MTAPAEGQPALVQSVLQIPKGLMKPLLAIQGELADSPVVKNRKADAGKKQYGYADLPAVLDVVLGACRKHGVLLTQPPVMEGTAELAIATILGNADGDQMCAVMRLPRAGDAQALGSAITYLRRYSILSLFSLAPEDDDDDGKRGTDAARQTKLVDPPAPTKTATEQAPKDLRGLIIAKLLEAWPDAGPLLEDKSHLSTLASALCGGKGPKDLSEDERTVWFTRLSSAPVEKIIDKTGSAMSKIRESTTTATPAPAAASEAPKAEATPSSTATATTYEQFVTLFFKRIEELADEVNPVEQMRKDFADPVRKAELLCKCCAVLYGAANQDPMTWSPEDRNARYVKLAGATVDNLRKKIGGHVLIPF